jgi:hypothetical protein
LILNQRSAFSGRFSARISGYVGGSHSNDAASSCHPGMATHRLGVSDSFHILNQCRSDRNNDVAQTGFWLKLSRLEVRFSFH